MVWKQPTRMGLAVAGRPPGRAAMPSSCPFRVFVLTGAGTSRVVIDVAHKWRA
jgi:hypothetical protein